jgi:hypothetical protein
VSGAIHHCRAGRRSLALLRGSAAGMHRVAHRVMAGRFRLCIERSPFPRVMLETRLGLKNGRDPARWGDRSGCERRLPR